MNYDKNDGNIITSIFVVAVNEFNLLYYQFDNNHEVPLDRGFATTNDFTHTN